MHKEAAIEADPTDRPYRAYPTLNSTPKLAVSAPPPVETAIAGALADCERIKPRHPGTTGGNSPAHTN
jgi:hypothetical protein